MDERLQALLDSVQKTAATVGDTAADAAYGVKTKATQLLSVAKMNIRLMDLKTEVNAQLREVGELIYATHTGDPTDSEVLLEKLRGIDGLNDQIAELTACLTREKGQVCPVCGAAAQNGDAFCRACGTRL